MASAVARPWERAAFEIATTVASEDVQVTWVVRSTTELSLNVPSAVNCRVEDWGMVTLAGWTLIETRIALVTLSVVEPLTLPESALMVVLPTDRAVVRPGDPALAMEATEASEEDQLTVLVSTCVLPSVKVPVATNCCVSPRGSEGLAGVTAMETRVAAVTVSRVDPVLPEKLAEMVVVPRPAAVARPRLPAAFEIEATVSDDEDHVTRSVMSCVEPSE